MKLLQACLPEILDARMIYVSSSTLQSVSLENCIEELIGVGIRNIELSGGPKFHGDISDALTRYKEEHHLNFLIHNYFPPPEDDFVLNIASPNSKFRAKSVDFIKTSINLAHELGIDSYTVHAGYARDLRPARNGDYFVPDGPVGISKQSASDFMYQSLCLIAEHAVARGIRIGLENLFPMNDALDCSLLCTPSEIHQFLARTANDDNVGLLLDMGHLCISSNFFGFDKDEFIRSLNEEYQRKIFGIHLSENDGKIDQHGPLCPDSWQLTATRSFDLAKTSVTVECRGLETEDALGQFRIVEDVLGREV